jgi:hypothetical protein
MSKHEQNNHDHDELASTEDQGFFYRPKVIKTIINSLYGFCGLLIVIDLFATFDIGLHRHMVHPFEKVPGFYAIYGFVGCVVLVLIAKEMRKFLMRKEDYYDDMD